MLKRIVTYCVLLLCFGTMAPAQVAVESALDRTDILIGEQVHLTTKVSVDAKSRVKFPAYNNGHITEGVEVLEASGTDTVRLNEGRRWQLVRTYTLTAFDSALYSIPAVEVEVNGKKYSAPNPIGLKVSTVPVDTVHTDQFRGPHAPVEARFEWSSRTIWQSLLLWALLAVALACVLRLSDKKPVTRRVKRKPQTPPHQRAVEAMNRIQGFEEAAQEDIKRYYMELTDILRTYIFERFGFNAREMTSYEIIENLTRSGNEKALDELREILSTADLVKFAKYEATVSDSDRSMMKAINFVNTTKREEPVQKAPIVEVITLEEKKQRAVRFRLKAVAAISTLLCVGFALYLWYDLWQTFF